MSWWSTAPAATSVKQQPAYVTHTQFKEGDAPPTFPSYKKAPDMYDPTTGKKIPGKKPPPLYNPKTFTVTPNSTTTLYTQTLKSHPPINGPPPLNETNQRNTTAQYVNSDIDQMAQMEKGGLTFGGGKMRGGRKTKKRGGKSKKCGRKSKKHGGKKSKKCGRKSKKRRS